MNQSASQHAFNEFQSSGYEAEAAESWGDTETYKESARRTKAYSKQDWERFKAESEAVNLEIAALIDQDVAAEDPQALAAVEKARLLIDQWFYPCSRQMHAGLGRMYVEDPRFTATYEKIRPGMAEYLCRATAANAALGEP